MTDTIPTKTTLIVTTQKDISLPYLENDHTVVAYFEHDPKEFESVLRERTFQVIYIRDPFNNPPFDTEDITRRLELLYSLQPNARYIDSAQDIDKVFFEDKWVQYQTLAEVIPETVMGKTGEIVGEGKIAKKRISARSRDILFPGDVLPGDDWIIQNALYIKEELRVYVIKGEIIPLASIKRSKANDQTTKVVGIRELTQQETDFVAKVVAKVPWMDFAGFDIVMCEEGLYLLEANRAPQFKKYSELTETNIAAQLFANS